MTLLWMAHPLIFENTHYSTKGQIKEIKTRYYTTNSIPKESTEFGGFPPSCISRPIQPISITNRSSCFY